MKILKFKDGKKADFNNRLFWNKRYETDPALGSGVGSRGECLAYKQALLKDAVEQIHPRTVLDIGCGDMAVSSALPTEGYTGIDTSNVVIQKNKKAFPGRSFIWGDFLDLDLPPSEMVVCLDVLIHLDKKNLYREFVKKIVHQTTRFGIIAGFEENPKAKETMLQPVHTTMSAVPDNPHRVYPGCFFHETISKTLSAYGVTRFRKIGGYNKTIAIMFEAPISKSFFWAGLKTFLGNKNS